MRLEPPGEGLSVDGGGPLPVGAVELRRVGLASAVEIAAGHVALDHASLEHGSDVGQLSSEFAVTLVESFQRGGHRSEDSWGQASSYYAVSL